MISDIVIGISDGLTVPFALTAGLTGVISSNSIIITAGISEIAAGAIAMGLGGYLAGRTEIDHYYAEVKREYYEIEHLPEKEKEEVREVFREFGLSETAQNLVTEELCKNKDNWMNFMMKFELGLPKPDERRAYKSAFNIGSSYVVGGLIPLLPYFLTPETHKAFAFSCVVTAICLLIFGYYKSKLTGQPLLKGALKTAVIGMIAAAAAFGIALMSAFGYDAKESYVQLLGQWGMLIMSAYFGGKTLENIMEMRTKK